MRLVDADRRIVPQRRPLTAEQRAARAQLAEIQRQLQERGVKAPKSGIFGRPQRERKAA